MWATSSSSPRCAERRDERGEDQRDAGRERELAPDLDRPAAQRERARADRVGDGDRSGGHELQRLERAGADVGDGRDRRHPCQCNGVTDPPRGG